MPRRNERNYRSSQVARVAGLALMAAVGGAIAGLLLAPKSGKQTRKDIKDRAENAKEKSREAIDNVKQNTEDKLHRMEDEYDKAIVEAETEEYEPRRGFWGRK